MPAAVQETVPCAALGVRVVTVRGSPLGSVSLASTSTEAGVSLVVERVSSTALGVNSVPPPTLEKANMNVLGVPRVGPSGVLGCPKE